MKLIKYLQYPAYYRPDSSRAVAYVREHFFNIRSNTRGRRILKRAVRPFLPMVERIPYRTIEAESGFSRIEPYLKKGRVDVVIAARRFYRLIDFSAGTVTSFLKKGIEPRFFNNEITARTALSGCDFIPHLMHIDPREMLFVEEYICSHPFKSCDVKRMDAGVFLDTVKDALKKVQSAFPVRTIDVESYTEELIKRVREEGDFSRNEEKYLLELREQALSLESIELVFAHSDFRKDQIFFSSNGRMIFIDWECSGTFSRLFDMMELYITEEWFYKDKTIALNLLLDLDFPEQRGACSLFLLELFFHPVRFQRRPPTSRELNMIKLVDRRLMKYALKR